ncbi:MAG TPA: hypothetical protein VE623_21100 [Acidimicrobiales bacterium]|nr:hypothetical protein [Acidimicrobiales bacterium]
MADPAVAALPAGKSPRCAPGLRAKGQRLWRDVVTVYTFRPDKLAVLERVCRLIDTISAMDVTIAEEGLLAAGSRGQTVPHPLVAERRQHEVVLSRLVRQLHLPDSPSEAEQVERSWRARRAARARWSPDRGSVPSAGD